MMQGLGINELPYNTTQLGIYLSPFDMIDFKNICFLFSEMVLIALANEPYFNGIRPKQIILIPNKFIECNNRRSSQK